MMLGFTKLLDRVRDVICVVLLGLIVVLICIQVFYRYVLNDPLSWPEEVARNAFVWVVALGTVKIFRDRTTYIIDAFINLAPAPVRRSAMRLFDAIALLMFAAILAGSWPVLAANAHIRTAIGLPINLLYASFPVAAALAMLGIAASVLQSARSTEA